MTIPSNIDLFNRVALAAFQRLYLSFPVPIDLAVNDLVMSAMPLGAAFDDAFTALSMGREALEFLAGEGFLTHKGCHVEGSYCLQVRLTMKGLAILGSIPASLTHKETLMSKIGAIAGKGLRNAASDQVQELTSQIFSFAMASAPTVAAMVLRR